MNSRAIGISYIVFWVIFILGMVFSLLVLCHVITCPVEVVAAVFAISFLGEDICFGFIGADGDFPGGFLGFLMHFTILGIVNILSIGIWGMVKAIKDKI